MVDNKAFSDALEKLRSLDKVKLTDVEALTGITYNVLRNMKHNRQAVTDEVVNKIQATYPQFEKYLEQAGREDSGQTSAPDEQAEHFKQILASMHQIVEEYASKNSTLEEQYRIMEQEYKKMRDKYIELLEKSIKG